MTKEQLAEKLNGRDCDNSPFLSKEESDEAKANGLVVVYGASDDLIEVEGAIDDEGGCYDGGEIYIDRDGLLANYDQVIDDDLPIYVERKRKAAKIFALWCSKDGFAWAYASRIPRATFIITDNNNEDKTYCEGIVFDVSELD
jgi:hypothetical protein